VKFTSVLVYYKTSQAYWSTTKLHKRIGLLQNFTCVLVYYKTSHAYLSTTKLHKRIGLLQNFTSVLVYYKTSYAYWSTTKQASSPSQFFIYSMRITYSQRLLVSLLFRAQSFEYVNISVSTEHITSPR
jgi:hypothetical protein